MEEDRLSRWWPVVRPALRTGLGLAAILTASCNGFCVTYSVYDFVVVPHDESQKAVSLGLAVLFAGIGLASAIVAKMALWPEPGSDRQAQAEQRILAFAESCGGRVTVGEVAAHCRLGITESRAALDRMASQGVAELLFTEEAVAVFRFPGLPSAAEKAAATSLDLEPPATPDVPQLPSARVAEALRPPQAEKLRADERPRLKVGE